LEKLYQKKRASPMSKKLKNKNYFSKITRAKKDKMIYQIREQKKGKMLGNNMK